MSATTHGLGCGLVLGIVFVLLAQQLAYLDLSALVPAVEYIVIAAVIGAVFGALVGWALGRRYLRLHPQSPSPSA